MPAYRRSLRPCLAPPSAPRDEAITLEALGSYALGARRRPTVADDSLPLDRSGRTWRGARALVEAVDLELEPVEAELADQVVLEQAGGVVGDAAAAEGGVDGEAADVDDPAAAVRRSQPIAPAGSPSSSITSRPPLAGSRSIARRFRPARSARGRQEGTDGLVGVEARRGTRGRLAGARIETSWPDGTVVALRQAHGARGERDAGEDQRQPAERRG